ncbi:MAG: OmpA family protein, partial [Gelidibacter sp.]
PNNMDDCPEVPGLKALKGCPDADADGVADHLDECPNEAGPAANKGCPWKDTDGDGVLDKDDKCPDVAGTVANNGCPETKPDVEKMKQLNDYARTILFDTGKATFKKESIQTLNSMNAIFKEFPEANFALEGYTDSVGAARSNQLLSERRANAVRDWLIANGIDQNRLTAKGFGEENPIDSNTTAAGRTNNRRVEVKLTN